MQNYLEKSSMFHDDLFTVVVPRRPVASSKLPCVDTGQAAISIWYRLGLISFGKI